MGVKKATETDLVKVCLEWLKLRGVFAWRHNTTGVRRRDKAGREFWAFGGLAGVSDILGILPAHCDPLDPDRNWPRFCGAGRFLAVEAKIRPNKPTAAQQAFLTRVNAAGGLGVVVYDLDDLRRALEDIG